jgi:hypothetical protein
VLLPEFFGKSTCLPRSLSQIGSSSRWWIVVRGTLSLYERDDPGDPQLKLTPSGTLTILPIDMISYILSQMPTTYRSRQ